MARREHEPVVLSEPDPDWATAARTEREALLEALGGRVVGVEHVGSTAVPRMPARPILDFIAEARVPLMATVGTSSVVEPMDAKRRWVFKTTQNDDLIAAALVRHMAKTGVKTVGFIGFKDPYGENWQRVFTPMAEQAGIRLVATEWYQRTDASVTGQALKLVAAEIKRVTASAPSTCTPSASDATVPPSATTRARKSKVMPSAPGPSS